MPLINSWGMLSAKTINLLLSLSRKLSKTQHNYPKIEKELLSMVECINKSRGMIFRYKINLYSGHKNLLYVATKSEYQILMHWRLIIK